MQYFEGLTLEADIKARYKELAKKYHPDLGGCVETMKVINLQYERVITGAYQKAGKSITEIEELLANDQALREKIDAIVCLPDIFIELCGNWIWVTGDTYRHKDRLKQLTFFWAQKKCAWYWRKEASKSPGKSKPLTLDQIRLRHGTHQIPTKAAMSLG